MSDRIGFTLMAAQWERVRAWEAEVWPRAIAKSRRRGVPLRDGRLSPDYGCCGGGVSFTFIPTSVGMVCTVREAITGEEIVLNEDVG